MSILSVNKFQFSPCNTHTHTSTHTQTHTHTHNTLQHFLSLSYSLVQLSTNCKNQSSIKINQNFTKKTKFCKSELDKFAISLTTESHSKTKCHPSTIRIPNASRIQAPHLSSKELGFFNPRSQLNSTLVTYWPHAAQNEEDR